jgi:hypothetical protein
MERINPSQLVSRVNPISDDKMIIKIYIAQIEQEIGII